VPVGRVSGMVWTPLVFWNCANILPTAKKGLIPYCVSVGNQILAVFVPDDKIGRTNWEI